MPIYKKFEILVSQGDLLLPFELKVTMNQIDEVDIEIKIQKITLIIYKV